MKKIIDQIFWQTSKEILNSGMKEQKYVICICKGGTRGHNAEWSLLEEKGLYHIWDLKIGN